MIVFTVLLLLVFVILHDGRLERFQCNAPDGVSWRRTGIGILRMEAPILLVIMVLLMYLKVL